MSPAEADCARRARIVLEALGWLGTPYRHQASVRGQGADCLGLVRGVMRAVTGRESEHPPPYPQRLTPGAGEPLLEAAGRNLVRTLRPWPGDVLVFRMRRSMPASHCGLLITEERFIHAYEGRGVLTTALSAHWQRRIAATFSFPEVP